MRRALFCSYRDWASEVFLDIWNQFNDWTFAHARNPEELEKLAIDEEWDVIILVGWSWKVPAKIIETNLVIGMHPSDLPMYAGGSPIQNQILDGIEQTRATLFKLNEQFDKGDIIDKEPIDLRGHLDQVFISISRATVELIVRFANNFPNNTYTKQVGERHTVRRLKPEHSRLPLPVELTMSIPDDMGNVEEIVDRKMTCKEMWDFIRCREDPYPNAYFEDETGRLIIKRVEFEPK